MSGPIFKGLGTALVTPFLSDEALDINGIRALVSQQIEGGVNFLVPCGTTGESPTLNDLFPGEHLRVVLETVEIAAGRVPVLAGTGSNSTREAIELTKESKKAGANGVLVVSPYYNKPMRNGFLDYYKRIAEAGLPVILYDIPPRTAKGVPTDVILQLAEEGLIVGMKWASGDFGQLMEIIKYRPQDFVVLSGDDNSTFPLMALGGDGVISVVSNIIPKGMKKFMLLMSNGEWHTARAIHYGLLDLMKAMFIETNPIPVKTALALMHPETFGAYFRSPMMPMEEKNVEKLKGIIARYDLS